MRKQYGIRITHEVLDRPGWLVDENLRPRLYPTVKKAKEAIAQITSNKRYTWNCLAEAAMYEEPEEERE